MANIAQRSFAKGEIAPALYARTDQIAYATGLRTCRNFRVLRQGGVENRPGTVLVGQTPNNGVVRLLPFVFNSMQTYVLEFSHLTVRFIRQGAYLMSGGVPYSVTTPYTAAELPNLRIAQSADVVTIVHPNHEPRALSRTADTNWTLAVMTFAPAVAAPTGLTGTPYDGSGGTWTSWVVTAVDAETGAESVASAPYGLPFGLRASFYQPLLTWTAVTGAGSYNIYKGGSVDGSTPSDYGFIGSTSTTAFQDTGFVADMQYRATKARNPFTGTNNYPAATTYFQGRRIFAGTTNDPEKIWTSRSADYNNFTESYPSQDDDALTLGLAAREVAVVEHLLDHVSLYVFTSEGEWVLNGDGSGVLRPTDITALNFSKHGSSSLPPIPIDARILFCQARGTAIRDISRDPFYGYKGNDLTLMSVHLFDGHALVDWAYQEVPHSIVWVVRDDGVLLGLTDVAEQQILAWHRHDTLGLFENVCVVPEGREDAVYVCVNRNGARYVERFASRYFSDVQDAIFLDAALSYDGRNTDGTKTVTIAGGTSWQSDELLTLNANNARFTAGDVGNAWFVAGVDATGAAATVRFRVTQYVSTTQVKGFTDRDVPTTMRSATSAWARAVDQVGGLQHLNGRAVGVFADGNVVASPNNPEMAEMVVSGGTLTLDQPYAYIHVGLPFVSDLETLDIDTPEGPSLKDKKLNLQKLVMVVQETRGIFAGSEPPEDDSTAGLSEFKARDHEDWNESVRLRTETIEVGIYGSWKTSGRVFVRQVDPLPITVLGLVPTGSIPSPSGG